MTSSRNMSQWNWIIALKGENADGKRFVAVKILDLPGAGSGCACSSTPRGPEFVATLIQNCNELKEALETSFPGKTSAEYVDISQSPEEKETEAGKLLVSKQYPSPLVVINGVARFAGSIQVNQIVKAVGEMFSSAIMAGAREGG